MVDNVSLEVPRGEFFALLGPSGCGKTTLLRMIAGFETPDSGTISIDGEMMNTVPPNLRPTNMVFQSYAIFPHLNVFDNIAYGLRKLKLPKEALRARVEAMLATVRLEGLGGRAADQLSGGQRQRVALARALVREPKILLLDEPLGALDKRLREAMQLELRAIQRKVGITFVLVTHDQEEALSLSDRVAVMEGGRILQVASPREIYERPGSRAVADFIGEINFFHATVKEMTGETATVNAGLLGDHRPAPRQYRPRHQERRSHPARHPPRACPLCVTRRCGRALDLDLPGRAQPFSCEDRGPQRTGGHQRYRTARRSSASFFSAGKSYRAANRRVKISRVRVCRSSNRRCA